jgi:hypothetical protein
MPDRKLDLVVGTIELLILCCAGLALVVAVIQRW